MSTTVAVRGATIRAQISGDPGTPPLVLLHGIGRCLEDWTPQHERFAGDYRVISLDLPGFGLSDPLPEPATLDSLASGVEQALAALGEDRPRHLMGNSLGGAVAMRMLCRDPDRTRSLTLVNSAGFGRTVAPFLRLLAVPGLGPRALRRIDRKAAWRIERSVVGNRSFVTDERVDFGLRMAARPEWGLTFLQAAKALGGIHGVRRRWRDELLAEVVRHRKPTLVVWGEKDLILPVAHLTAARALLPYAESHLFPDAGHMPQLEQPDEFAALAGRFLAASEKS